MLNEPTGPKDDAIAPGATSSGPAEVAQHPDGRWHWTAPPPLDGDPLALAFPSREEALADRGLRLAAPIDASGRRVLSKDHLRRLISTLARFTPACSEVFFGGVYWHPRDAGGCNWSVGVASCIDECDACLAALAATRTEMRRRYAIVDEG